jgi:diguanylate cyclase (GGDEF)-like protein
MDEAEQLSRRTIKHWIRDCRNFFRESASVNSERNWETLHPMTLLYLAYLIVYLFAVCPVLIIPLQTSVVTVFTVLHLLFTLIIWLSRKTPPIWAVDLLITLFAAQILALSGFLGIAVAPKGASFVFPLCLVLMTQIYTRRPIRPILETVISSGIYLTFCFLTENSYEFTLDIITIVVALGIAGAALFSNVSFKMRSYYAQRALENMCALDPMTGISNKTTFEFLVTQYLRSCLWAGHAFAICDLDSFKAINDRYGHHAGDEVLKAFAEKIRKLLGSNSNMLAGRFGGDEFVIFIKHYKTRREVQDQLGQLNSISGFPFPVTCSIGIAFSESEETEFQDYFAAADESLYMAKAEKSGKLCITDA